MPLPRLLLPLCGLLLALAVTGVTAQAPLYGPGELSVIAVSESSSTTRDAQFKYCSVRGGSLVPMVTEAVYTLVTKALDDEGAVTSFSYMGASTMMSGSVCSTEEASLNCIWYWDEGRYSGVEGAIAFYQGNRDVKDLPGARMLSKTVNNHWHVSDDTTCPCAEMQRYSAVLRDEEGLPYWSDTSDTAYSYASGTARTNYRLCGYDNVITTTTTRAPNGVANRPLVISLPVAVAFAVMAVVAWL